jgi:hypothetical protein
MYEITTERQASVCVRSCVGSITLLLLVFFASSTYAKGAISPIEHAPLVDSIQPGCHGRAEIDGDGVREEFPSEISITVKKSRQRAWAVNLLKALTSRTHNIPDSAKKWFDADVSWQVGGRPCTSLARIRVTGDWRDHISYSGVSVVSSLAVKLKEGHISTIVKFKLLLPETRGGENEILATTLFSEFDFLSPETRMVMGNLNGVKIPFLFQEMPVKEFVERHQLRESIVLEGDERRMWQRVQELDENRHLGNLIFARIDNSAWLKNQMAVSIGLSALSEVNPMYMQHWIEKKADAELSALVPANLLAQANNHIRGESLFVLLSTLVRGSHGLRPHNRKFYYDAMYGMLVPIYYDGNAFSHETVQRLDGSIPESEIALVVEKLNSEVFRSSIYSNYLARGGTKSKQAVDKMLAGMVSEALAIVPMTLSNVPSISHPRLVAEFMEEREAGGVREFYIWNVDQSSLELCWSDAGHGGEPQFRCVPSDEEVAKLLADPIIEDKVPVPFVGSVRFDSKGVMEFTKPDVVSELFVKNPGELELTVAPHQVVFIDFTTTSTPPAELKLLLESKGEKTGRVVIRGSVPRNSRFFLTGDSLATTAETRYNERLLTSCLTFVDANLSGVEIVVKSAPCEDGVNFVRTNGDIDSIVVTNAHSDAIDADYSDLSVENIVVHDAGNDCVDLSSGDYSITNMRVAGCGDKGLSIGEKARVNVTSLEIEKAVVGVVVKDSSTLRLEKGSISQEALVCLAAYRKKQEFDGGRMIVPNELIESCAGKVVEQAYSLIQGH